MQRIDLPPEYQLMSPLDQCKSMGLIIPPERMANQSILRYLVIGSMLTIALGLIIYYAQDQIYRANSEKH